MLTMHCTIECAEATRWRSGLRAAIQQARSTCQGETLTRMG